MSGLVSPRVAGGRREGVGGGGGDPRVLGTLCAQSITVTVDFTLRTAHVGYLW